MKNFGKDFWVGFLIVASLGLMIVFAWLLGIFGPFFKEARFVVFYDFVGGVEVGSPVRVAGVKVGKVQSIEFTESGVESSPAAVRMTISVAAKALPAVRQDSKFFVNIAGIIGERYVEISPGSASFAVLADGSIVRGEDPPRIDQLLSQGYDVFGKVQEFLDTNRTSIGEFLKNIGQVMHDANRLLKGKDRTKLVELIENLYSMSNDLKVLTQRTRDPEFRELLGYVSEIIERVHKVDGPNVKRFFQEEGVRARIF